MGSEMCIRDRVGTGHNMLTSRLQTENQVTRVEAMTLRVWRARLESVAFGKDAPRQVTALFSTEAEAQTLADHLCDFGRAQSVLMAPTSTEDHARLSALGQAEGVLAQASPQVPGAPQAIEAITTAALAPAISHDAQATPAATSAADAAAARYCSACGHKAAAQARFCSACGAAMPQ